MLLHATIENSSVNGPGNRAVIWFQGCNLQCAGCWNPATHAFKGKQTSIFAVMAWVAQLRNIDGLTFSGGEPMQHFPELRKIVECTKERFPHLSLGMYSGYTVKELSSGNWQYFDAGAFRKGSLAEWNIIRECLDFAVCGRYNNLQATSALPLCGSSNQRIELLSDRYTIADFQEQLTEVTISEDGSSTTVTGFPTIEFLNSK